MDHEWFPDGNPSPSRSIRSELASPLLFFKAYRLLLSCNCRDCRATRDRLSTTSSTHTATSLDSSITTCINIPNVCIALEFVKVVCIVILLTDRVVAFS